MPPFREVSPQSCWSNWGGWRESNPLTIVPQTISAPFGFSHSTPGQIRTDTGMFLRHTPLPLGYEGLVLAGPSAKVKPMEKKTCTECGIEKLLEDFSLHSKGRGGRNPKCKECKNKQARHYFEQNRVRLLAVKNTRRNNVTRFTQYGITQDEYLQLYKDQDGQCKICGAQRATLPIDHNHKTGKVRGLLCHSCNFGLGHFQDSVQLLTNAIAYLESGGSGIRTLDGLSPELR